MTALNTSLILAPAWHVGIPRHLIGLWVSVGVWRNCMSSKKKKNHTGPHPTSINATHIPAPVPDLPHNIQTQCLVENLAPVKTIMHYLSTHFPGAAGESALGPNWQGLSTDRGYKPSWCLSPRRKRRRFHFTKQNKIQILTTTMCYFNSKCLFGTATYCRKIGKLCQHTRICLTAAKQDTYEIWPKGAKASRSWCDSMSGLTSPTNTW